MAFNNYLEDENDKPYFTTNSLAYYYDKMEGFAKAVEGSAKALNLTKEEIEQRIALRLAEWDKNLESFDGSVEKLLTEWVDDGTLTHVIDSTLIDQKIAPVALQLEEKASQKELETRGTDIKSFGAIGDGITDDTASIQTALNSGKRIFWTNGVYYFKRVFITNDNSHIEFADKVVLKSDYNGDSLGLASFEINGMRGESFPIEEDVAEFSNSIKINNVSTFSIGDFITLEQNNPTGTSLSSHRQKYLHCVVEIESIDSLTNTLKVHESIPHAYQLSNSAKVVKVFPVKNVTIIGQNTLFDKLGTNTYANHMTINYGVNINVSGFVCVNGGGKAITISKTNGFFIENIEHRNPSNVSAGHGYCIQMSAGSSNGIVQNIKAYNSRHGIDLSGGCYRITIKDSYGFKAPFNGHGQNSKNITFDNCRLEGSGFGMGNSTFLSDEKWKFINCTSTNSTDGFFITSQSFDVDMINCTSLNSKSTGVLLNVGTKNVRYSNLKIINSVAIGLDIRCSDVSGESLYVEKAYLNIRNGATNINLKNVSILNSLTFPMVKISESSSDIRISDLKMRGICYRGVEIFDDCKKMYFDNVDADLTDTARVIDSRSATTIVDRELTISNSQKLKTNALNGLSVFSSCGGIRLINNNLNNNITLADSPSGYVLQNNFLDNISLDIRSTKNTLVAGNYGKTYFWKVPAHNGDDVIIANNVTTII